MHCVKSAQIQSFFWSVFSRIRTEYREIRSISSYSFRMRENTDQKKLRIRALFTQCPFCCFPLISAIILFIKTWKIVFQTCFRATYGMDKIKIKHYVKLWNIMSDNCIFDDVLLRFFSSVRVSAKIPVSFYMF